MFKFTFKIFAQNELGLTIRLTIPAAFCKTAGSSLCLKVVNRLDNLYNTRGYGDDIFNK